MAIISSSLCWAKAMEGAVARPGPEARYPGPAMEEEGKGHLHSVAHV